MVANLESESRSGALQRAYEGISHMIMMGELNPGVRLRESFLADALGVSRTPVREALRRLSAEGMVEMLPNRGAFLIGLSQQDLNALFELRARMEPYAVQLAVPLLTAAELDRMQVLVNEMNMAAAVSDFDLLGRLNNEFHAMFLTRSGNRLLAGAVSSVIRPSIVRRVFHQYSPRALARSMAHHQEIVEAARAGDADWAEAVMRAHILAGRSTVRIAPPTED
jgi:DNA-binding GntR family transcriptional regulator